MLFVYFVLFVDSCFFCLFRLRSFRPCRLELRPDEKPLPGYMGPRLVKIAVAIELCYKDAAKSADKEHDPMHEVPGISGVAHAIQLAIAPVFLLTAVGSILGVIANRLARVIDRARLLEGKLENAAPEQEAFIRGQLKILSRRAKFINIAITACVVTALLVCAVIAILFSGSYASFDSKPAVSIIFILAMFSLMVGLLCFLEEVFLATLNLRIGPK
jgi:hypothetical protein